MLECRLAKAALRIVATTKTWVPQVNATYCTADAGLIAIAEGLKFRCLSPSVITGCPRKTVPRTREVTINCSHSAGMKHGLELTLAQRRASAMGGSGVLLFVVNCMNGRANQQSHKALMLHFLLPSDVSEWRNLLTMPCNPHRMNWKDQPRGANCFCEIS